MKLKNLMLGTALTLSASAANATTAFYPTDGDINFVIGTGDLDTVTLAIFDDAPGVGTQLDVTTPGLIYWDGTDTLGDTADFLGNTLTIADGDFVLAVFDGTSWIGGEINMTSALTNPEANSYAVQFAGVSGFELVIDVTPIPVPAAVWLFGTGLLGLVGVARRKG